MGKRYDVIVIGAGHAGIEAALAAARLGCRTCVFALSLDSVGNMPCNPAIGGSSKGHIVREIDALGGEMGRAADKNALQCRILNLGKGAAVQSPRAQIDRRAYADHMKHVLEQQEFLDLKQAEITHLKIKISRKLQVFHKALNKNLNQKINKKINQKYKIRRNISCWQVETKTGQVYTATSVILATGTFLRGKIHIGTTSYAGGPDGLPGAQPLGACLEKLGLPLRRFKTGTPARVHRRSIDFTKLQEQFGDPEAICFSFFGTETPKQLETCHLTYTTPETKKVILANLDRSPLYSGAIEGVGPRYCPSIEDKVVRFPEKERHALFLEPCGANTEELYVQGMSSSLPEEVQEQVLRSIPGLEQCEIMRPAYAIEYDCVDPQSLALSLEFRSVPGLFGAGQFNGSSGYEEAAAQGLLAGINAAQRVKHKAPLILSRYESYIGVLIDDLVTQGCKEPYRMMTSRSEVRLHLRHDTADQRLSPYGIALGLISKERENAFLRKQEQIQEETKRIRGTQISPSEALNQILETAGTSRIIKSTGLVELLKRPELSYSLLKNFDEKSKKYKPEVYSCIEHDLKYEGYVKRQEAQVQELKRLEQKKLPEKISYEEIQGLRLEAREKLSLVRPETLGQAARISGVTPADLTVLLLYL